MDVHAFLWLAKPLQKYAWPEDLDRIVILSVAAAILIYTAVRFFLSYRCNRFCTCCRSKTVLGWRTEKIDARNRWVRIGSKWHYGGVVYQKIAVIRCPQCGWEIDLGKS